MASRVILHSHAMAIFVLCTIELVVAIVRVILTSVLAGKLEGPIFLRHEWSGLPDVVPGIIGIVVGLTENCCGMVNLVVVFSIVSFNMDLYSCNKLMGCYGKFSEVASADTCTYNSLRRNCYCSGSSFVSGVDSCDNLETITVLILTIFVFAVSSCIVSFAASIVGFSSMCCRPQIVDSRRQSDQPGTVTIQPPAPVQCELAQPQQGYAPGAGNDDEPPPPYSLYEQHPKP